MLVYFKHILQRKCLVLPTTLLACVSLYFLWTLPSVRKIFRRKCDGIEIRGTNPSDVHSESDYVFIYPRYVNADDQCVSKENIHFSHGVHQLSNLLDGLSYDFGGATCHGSTNIQNRKHLEMIKACKFQVKQWSLLIGGSEYRQVIVLGQKYNLAACNIVETPFLVRRTVLNKFGFRRSFGELTVMDFFLRAKGKLKIAALQDCTFLPEQFVIDRGAMTHKRVYLDYSLLGFHYNILRIVRQNTVTWTVCSRLRVFCPDIPAEQRKEVDIPCCSERLDQFLIDVVEGLKKVGINYRICYGTHLGAYRSKTIIPWTHDVDICVSTKDYKDKKLFAELKSIMAPKYSVTYIDGIRRVIPMYPYTKTISDKTQLFSDSIVNAMKRMGPLKKPGFESLGYADIYGYNKVFEGNPSLLLINGRSYLAYNDSKAILHYWYGDAYIWKIDGSASVEEPNQPKLDEAEPSVTQEDT